MLNRRVTLWATLLLIAALALSACAPRSGQGTAASAESDPGELVVDLPAIVIDIMADGSPSMGNVPLTQIGDLIFTDLSAIAVPSVWVDFMVASNIQHIQVNNTSNGLHLLVNGEAVPSISYDGESLSATADALSSLGIAIPMIDKLLGLVDQIGIGATVRFPVAAGTAIIPMYVEGNGSAAMAAQAAQEEFLAAVGTPPRVNLPIWYEEDGSFSIGNLTAAEWSSLTSGATDGLRLSSDQISNLTDSGISELSISTDVNGIIIAINGNALPVLDWSGGKATHLLNLVTQLGALDMIVPGMGSSGIMATVHDLLPVIQTTDFDLTVHLPAAGMAAAN